MKAFKRVQMYLLLTIQEVKIVLFSDDRDLLDTKKALKHNI